MPVRDGVVSEGLTQEHTVLTQEPYIVFCRCMEQKVPGGIETIHLQVRFACLESLMVFNG